MKNAKTKEIEKALIEGRLYSKPESMPQWMFVFIVFKSPWTVEEREYWLDIWPNMNSDQRLRFLAIVGFEYKSYKDALT